MSNNSKNTTEISDIDYLTLVKQSPEHFNSICTILLQRHRKLIHYTANKYGMNEIPIEDRIIVCQIGFCEFVRLYDREKTTGNSITTYSVWKMRSELTKLHFELFPWMNQEGLARPLDVEINESLQIGLYDEISDNDSRITNPLQELIQKQAIEIIQKALEQLSERDRFIYVHMLGLFGQDEMSSLDLEEELGLSHQRIYQIFEKCNDIVTYQIQDNYRVKDWRN